MAIKFYIHICDVCRRELAILERGRLGQIYHLSPDRAIAAHDIMRVIFGCLGRRFEDARTVVDERGG